MPPAMPLPPVPPELANDRVAAWFEPLLIDSYLPEEPSPYPAFLNSRVYQGSSGRVFPLPFHERISQERKPHSWAALHLENEWVRLVILPELGGRIYVGYDKVADYDFFYRNSVIKPALVGLAGPWVSGGVEFNWPQHHRPATFLSMDYEIERERDGAVTVWCSDHDPFTRMKGMHGIRLRPDTNVIEARIRLYNRTDETQTFLWWANVAAAANNNYQSFFPTDVNFVADHAKRAIASFPQVDGRYYGIDYPARVSATHPDADRLDWYRNILVPTSYMVPVSDYDFFGGYDHRRRAGFVHWADHSIVPGKKQWTWGTSEFGVAWDRNLTDDDGPYVELMAGAFTDNQPDFSFISPGETKSFSQYWYPIQQIGTVQQATLDAALHLVVVERSDGASLEVGVAVTAIFDDVTIDVRTAEDILIFGRRAELSPGSPFFESVEVDLREGDRRFVARVLAGGRVLVQWTSGETSRREPPAIASEPSRPEDIDSADELFYTGQYLEQYRHATRRPEPYWQAILDRDPSDVRANLAMGAVRERAHHRAAAESHFRVALGRLLGRVPNPADGEAHYRLGINLTLQGRDREAISFLKKATWHSAWAGAASLALGRLHSRSQSWAEAAQSLRDVIALDPSHLQATALLAVVLRHSGESDEAERLLRAQFDRDPLDQWTRDLLGFRLTADAPTLLDVAIEYEGGGFHEDALRLLDHTVEAAEATPRGQVNVGPLARYHRALVTSRQGADPSASLQSARRSNALHCLPSRREDIDALQFALRTHADDPVAASLLASWNFSQGNHERAIALWSLSLESPSDPIFAAITHRNLGIATYNIRRHSAAAREHFEEARRLAPEDSKLLNELDQLMARTGVSAAERYSLLDAHPDLVAERDDLTIAWVTLLVTAGFLERAEAIMRERAFQPWEGGEGLVLAAWDSVKIKQFHRALSRGDGESARNYISEAVNHPSSLGEARHPMANQARLQWLTGLSERALGRDDLATSAWEAAADHEGEPSDQTQWSIRALAALGRHDDARALTERLEQYALGLLSTPARIDFFATSLPSLLTFHDDPTVARHALGRLLLQQVAALGQVKGFTNGQL